MKFYTQTHQYYFGIDLHARSLYVCIMDRARKGPRYVAYTGDANGNVE